MGNERSNAHVNKGTVSGSQAKLRKLRLYSIYVQMWHFMSETGGLVLDLRVRGIHPQITQISLVNLRICGLLQLFRNSCSIQLPMKPMPSQLCSEQKHSSRPATS